MIPIEQQLYNAAADGRASEVSSLLRDHIGINVNWIHNTLQMAPLHAASFYNQAEVVKVLVAHPTINVNIKSDIGHTPFSLGCRRGHVSVVRLLLKDPRVDITLEDPRGCTPLWYAAYYGEHEVIEWLIASGKDIGIENKKGKAFGQDYTVLEIARERGKTEVMSLLERFIADPALIRHELRVKLGMLDELAAEVFVLTVFLCDGLLQLKPASHPAAAATRFFAIASKLPMELQMILCHRAVGSMKQNILRKNSEAAFQSLARILLSLQPK